MRVTPILIFALLPTSLPAAQQENHPAYTLVVQSADLPEKDRQDILKNIDVSSWPLWNVKGLVSEKVRDLGYLQAEVEEQRQASNNHTQLTENIKAGIRYKLRTIKVVKATLFSPEQLRREIRLSPGDVASLSEISNGLERIRLLYGNKGYIDTVITPTPRFDSRQGLVDITLKVDEGKPYRFGKLLVNGVEPYPGAAQQLTASWKPLRGQTFNLSAIDKWLHENQASCPSCTWQRNTTVAPHGTTIPSNSSNLLDVTLHLPPRPLP